MIAIGALLIGLLLPVLGSARDAARSASCGSNLRQMTVAMHGYFHDNRGAFFPELQTTPAGKRWWFGFEAAGGPAAEGQRLLDRTRGALYRYYGISDSIEFCPAYPLSHPDYKAKFTTNWTTYGPSERLIEPSLRIRLDHITRPSGTLAFADTSQRNNFQFPASPSHPRFEQWHYVQAAAKSVLYLHADAANAARLDGSANLLHYDSPPDLTFPGVVLARPPAGLRLTP